MAYSGSSAAILATYDEALKYMYLPAIQEYLNHDTILADKIGTNEKDVSGKLAYIENHYGRSTGIGARADGGALPEADYQKFKKSEVSCKYNYGRVTFSGPTIKATRDERGTYAKVVENEIQGIVKDAAKDNNRQMWGCGYGVIARWRSGTADPYTVQKKYCNNSAGGDAFGSTFGSKYIDDWAVTSSSYASGGYDIVTCSFSSGCLLATVDGGAALKIPLTGTITEASDGTYVTLGTTHTDPAPSPSEAAGTFLVRWGNMRSVTSGSAAGHGRLEMMGIRGIATNTNLDDIAFTDGTSTNTGFASSSAPTTDSLQGLDVDTYTWFKAQVLSASGGRYSSQRQITPKLMQQMFDKVELKAGKDYGPDMIITTHAIRREYLDYMEARRRNVNTMELDGGWIALDYNGVPLMVDPDAIDGEMYFLTLKDLQVYRMSDWDWMDQDGAILSRLSGYDAYEAVLYRYAELGVNNRQTQGVITDLAYDAD